MCVWGGLYTRQATCSQQASYSAMLGTCLQAKPGVSTESGSKAASCAKCFEVSSVPKANREACIAGITAPGGSAASAAGAAACLDTYVTDRTKCQSCAAKAKTTTEANACGACTNGGNVPARCVCVWLPDAPVLSPASA